MSCSCLGDEVDDDVDPVLRTELELKYERREPEYRDIDP